MEETPLNRNVQLVLIHEHKKQQAKCSPSAPDGNLVCSPKLGLDLYPSIAVKKFSFFYLFVQVMSVTLKLAENTELWLGKASSCAVSAVKSQLSSYTARLSGATWKRRQEE